MQYTPVLFCFATLPVSAPISPANTQIIAKLGFSRPVPGRQGGMPVANLSKRPFAFVLLS